MYNNRKVIITSALIALTLSNVSLIRAEGTIASEQVISEVEETQNNSESVLEFEELLEKKGDSLERLESFTTTLSEEQIERISKIVFYSEEHSDEFINALLAHLSTDYLLASEVYTNILENNELSADSVDLIEILIELANAEQGLLNNFESVINLVEQNEVDTSEIEENIQTDVKNEEAKSSNKEVTSETNTQTPAKQEQESKHTPSVTTMRQVETADGLYNRLMSSGSVSQRWSLAESFIQKFPNDSRVANAINFAANSQINYAERLHRNGDYTSAVVYYQRILSTPLISDSMQRRAQVNLEQAQAKDELLSSDTLYNRLMSSGSVSERWNLALKFVEYFENDARVTEAVSFAVNSQTNYAERLHRNNDFKSAVIYYERILSIPLINKSMQERVQLNLAQAKNKQELLVADDLYNRLMRSNSVSERWSLAEKFVQYFGDDSRAKSAVSFAANSQVNYGLRLHRADNYKSAIPYYVRVMNNTFIGTATSEEVQGYLRQAQNNQKPQTASELYGAARSSGSVSQRWSLAQQFKHNFPNDSRVKSIVNFAADSQLKYAVRLHREKNFKSAQSYYQNLLNEDLVDYSSQYKAEVYHQLAENNLELTNLIFNYTSYSTELNTAVDIQLSQKAQASNSSGGWRNATRAEVEKYINPNNFLPDDLSNTGVTLFTIQITASRLNVRTGPSTNNPIVGQVQRNESYTILDEENGWYKIEVNNQKGWISGASNYVSRNNDILQFLLLSGTSGISNNDLNAMLTGAGILENRSNAFRKASQEANVNEIYLVSHALLETGRGSSALAMGILVDTVDGKPVTPRVVYNMYGIGAMDSNPNKLGSERAYKLGWFTPEEAIIGGAKWIASSYINNATYKQDTLYKMRWNPESVGTHQYATDVGWASKQTNTLNNLVDLSRKYGLILKFDIPIYKK